MSEAVPAARPRDTPGPWSRAGALGVCPPNALSETPGRPDLGWGAGRGGVGRGATLPSLSLAPAGGRATTTALLLGACATPSCACLLSVSVSPVPPRPQPDTVPPTCAPPPHRVDNNHLLLLMIHVFRENEEQLFKVSPRDSRADRSQQAQARQGGRVAWGCGGGPQCLTWLGLGPPDDPDEHGAHGGHPAAAVRAAHGLLRVPAPERCLPPLSPSPPHPESPPCPARGDASAPHGRVAAVPGPPLQEPPPSFQITGPGVCWAQGPGPRKWFRGKGNVATVGNQRWGLLSQGPPRSRTWWKRLSPTTNWTTCR